MENYIYHHGIKGQKWKVRRFQNKDGSLTAAGRKRYQQMSDDDLKADIEKSKKREERTQLESQAISARTTSSRKYYEQARETSALDRSNKYLRAKKDNLTLKADIDRLTPKEKSKWEDAGDKLETASKLVSKLQDINQKHTERHTTKERFDLSEMSDKQLRDSIERQRLEDQYHQMFAQDVVTISKGRERLNKIVDGAAGAIAIGTSVVSLALMIKQLKG